MQVGLFLDQDLAATLIHASVLAGQQGHLKNEVLDDLLEISYCGSGPPGWYLLIILKKNKT